LRKIFDIFDELDLKNTKNIFQNKQKKLWIIVMLYFLVLFDDQLINKWKKNGKIVKKNQFFELENI
jgi:hypothetical protein